MIIQTDERQTDGEPAIPAMNNPVASGRLEQLHTPSYLPAPEIRSLDYTW